MTDPRVQRLLTEDELDAALSALHSDPAVALAGPDAAGEADMDDEHEVTAPAAIDLGLPAGDQAPARRRRRVGRWAYPAVAAAVAAALITGGVVVNSHLHHGTPAADGGSPSTSPSPPETGAQLLNRLAGITARTPNPTVPAGKYLYVDWTLNDITSVGSGGGATYSYRQILQERTWIPSDTNGTWRHTNVTSAATQLDGKPAPASYGAGPASSETTYARCGDFYGVESGGPIDCGRTGMKQYTPHMLATLPRDPNKLLNWVLTNTNGGESGAANTFTVLPAILESGIVPPDLRAAMYRTLALVPGLTITNNVTVNGHTGVAIGDSNGDDVVIDPVTAQFYGNLMMSNGLQGTPQGTAMFSDSVTVMVVDHSGDTH